MIILDSGRVIDPSNRIDGTRTVLQDNNDIGQIGLAFTTGTDWGSN